MKETTIYISKENLLKNYSLLKEWSGTTVWPVLKSNAYGHGIDQVTEILKNTPSEYIIVQNYFEAEQIWNTAPKQNILLLGTEPFMMYSYMDFERVVPVVGSVKLLEFLVSLKKEISIHIKINTGMNRQGFDPVDIQDIITILQKNPHIRAEGIMTHFSDADGPDSTYTLKQYSCFESCVDIYKKSGIEPKWIHASNTAGLSKIKPNLVNASRSGIGLYGLSPLEKTDVIYEMYEQLEPVLSLHTYITHTRTIKPGEVVGYGNTYKAEKETRIATIPVGYYEGTPRIMSNKGFCSSTQGVALPIIGRVSMNLVTLDISGTTLTAGDEVIVYSSDKNFPNTVIINTKASGSISYELTTNLKPHIPRVIV